jgi:integrative and conjugative element protein (TIGR02256 family)
MRIHLAPEIEPRLRESLSRVGRREIGGMLFAEQLEPSRFCIVDFSLDLSSGTNTRFQRDPTLHRQELDRFFDRTGHDYQRFNYLGEWHSHPSFSVQPSAQDLLSMTDLVETVGSPISFAVLLIVRLRWWIWIEHSLTVFSRGDRPSPGRIARRIVAI